MQPITLSNIDFLPVRPHKGLIAFCSFTLNEQFRVSDIGIYTLLNGEGYRLCYPFKVLPNGKRIATFHPVSQEAGMAIDAQVFLEFEKFAKLQKGQQ